MSDQYWMLHSHIGSLLADVADVPDTDGQVVLTFRQPGRSTRKHLLLVPRNGGGWYVSNLRDGCAVLTSIANARFTNQVAP